MPIIRLVIPLGSLLGRMLIHSISNEVSGVMSFNLMYIVRLICTIQYIRGGQVGTFINEGGKEGVTNLGAGHKKGNLTSCPMLG